MIGFQEYVVKNKISVIKLSKEVGVSPGIMWGWFNKNKVPENHHDIISKLCGIDKDTINKVVNDIVTFKPRIRGFDNKYDVDGDITTFYITRRNGDIFKILIDTEDLPRLIELNLPWCIEYKPEIDDYYVHTTQYIIQENGKKKGKTIELHRFIMNSPKCSCIDHINHNTFDHRKSQLLISNDSLNIKNRKGANKNNKTTGVRNVSWIESDNAYRVQIMKDYKRYMWYFPANQFKEACEFAKQKRIELFGKA